MAEVNYMKFNRVKIARFQDQNCTLTLKEAMAEFYRINSHLFSIPKAESKWTELLIHHDVGHVFFGVNTSILDEAGGDYWTLMATDLSFKEYLGYIKTPEAKKLLKDMGVINIIKSLALGMPLLLKVYFRSRKMKKKWNIRGYDKYMDTPLNEIRKNYNLKILEYRN